MEAHSRDYRGLLRSILVLLVIIVGFQVGFALDLSEKNRLQAARARQVAKFFDVQKEAAVKLYTDYQDAAYHNKQVGTIMQQQLVATEACLAGLQLMFLQGAHMTVLLGAQ